MTPEQRNLLMQTLHMMANHAIMSFVWRLPILWQIAIAVVGISTLYLLLG